MAITYAITCPSWCEADHSRENITEQGAVFHKHIIEAPGVVVEVE